MERDAAIRPRTTCVYCGERITPPNTGGRCDAVKRLVRSLACKRHWPLVLLDAFYGGSPDAW